MVKAIKQVDVVISTLSYAQSADQVKIIAAIKEAGNVKVIYFTTFLYVSPSFGPLFSSYSLDSSKDVISPFLDATQQCPFTKSKFEGLNLYFITF